MTLTRVILAQLTAVSLALVFSCSGYHEDDGGGSSGDSDSDSDSDGDSDIDDICEDLCEVSIEVLEDCFAEVDCTLDDPDEAVSACENECEDVIDDLDSEDRGEAVDCLECLIDEIGDSPECADWEEAEEDCESECTKSGAEEYMDNFDSDYDYSCPDTDDEFDPYNCGGVPATCEDISSNVNEQFYGCCYLNTVYWCQDGGGPHSSDCDEEGGTCGYNEVENAMWCIS